MKRFVVCSLFLLLLIAGISPAFAQADVIIKNKAKAIRDSNNARQGIDTAPPVAPAPVAPSASATNAPRGIDPAQQAKIDKLENDISGIQAGVRVPLDRRKEIMDDTAALVRTTIKPSPSSVSNLVTHIALALAGKGVSFKDPAPAQLARDINVVVNSLNLSPGQVQPVIVAAQNLLRAATVPEDDYKPIIADLKTIVTELQKNKPKL
jgi:hypothetical protein